MTKRLQGFGHTGGAIGVRAHQTSGAPLAAVDGRSDQYAVFVSHFFALFISAYTIRMEEPDWRPLSERVLLWLNTAVLILASVAYHWTRNAAVAGREDRLKPGLIASGALTFLFLLGQLVAWQQLNAAGYRLDSNVANAFFYLLTAVHGLHMDAVFARTRVCTHARDLTPTKPRPHSRTHTHTPV